MLLFIRFIVPFQGLGKISDAEFILCFTEEKSIFKCYAEAESPNHIYKLLFCVLFYMYIVL